MYIYIHIHTHNRKSFTTRTTINSCTVYTKLIDFSFLDPALLDRCCSRDPRSFTDPDFPVVKLTALTQDFDIPTSSDIQSMSRNTQVLILVVNSSAWNWPGRPRPSIFALLLLQRLQNTRIFTREYFFKAWGRARGFAEQPGDNYMRAGSARKT